MHIILGDFLDVAILKSLHFLFEKTITHKKTRSIKKYFPIIYPFDKCIFTAVKKHLNTRKYEHTIRIART